VIHEAALAGRRPEGGFAGLGVLQPARTRVEREEGEEELSCKRGGGYGCYGSRRVYEGQKRVKEEVNSAKKKQRLNNRVQVHDNQKIRNDKPKRKGQRRCVCVSDQNYWRVVRSVAYSITAR